MPAIMQNECAVVISFHKIRHQKRRRRRFIARFRPELSVGRFSSIRLPFELSYGIRKHFKNEGKRRGYDDIREFFTDLAIAGFQDILTGYKNESAEYDLRTFQRHRDGMGWKVRVASVNLKAVPLREACLISRSDKGIDEYETLGILISIGWAMNPDGLEYNRNGINDKIYS